MDNNPFFIEFKHKNSYMLAEVKPCCQLDNVYYYDILIQNKYQFTVTPMIDDEKGLDWKVSLANADNPVDPELVHKIGYEIEKHLFD